MFCTFLHERFDHWECENMKAYETGWWTECIAKPHILLLPSVAHLSDYEDFQRESYFVAVCSQNCAITSFDLLLSVLIDRIQAIALSLRDTNLHDTIPETHYLFGNESKGDVIERLRNSFASRNRGNSHTFFHFVSFIAAANLLTNRSKEDFCETFFGSLMILLCFTMLFLSLRS